jgi:acetoin utilization protein AcuB
MIVHEVMTTGLVLVTPDNTLGHAANLLRQHQFHHLPVVQIPAKTFHWPGHAEEIVDTKQCARTSLPVFEGLLTSQDINLATAVEIGHAEKDAIAEILPHRPWQEQRVSEVMHHATITVTPSTSVATASQLLVERGLNCLPVVEHDGSEQEAHALLAGLLTRSDLLIALARSMGAYEPGVELHIPFVAGNPTTLTQVLPTQFGKRSWRRMPSPLVYHAQQLMLPSVSECSLAPHAPFSCCEACTYAI